MSLVNPVSLVLSPRADLRFVLNGAQVHSHRVRGLLSAVHLYSSCDHAGHRGRRRWNLGLVRNDPGVHMKMSRFVSGSPGVRMLLCSLSSTLVLVYAGCGVLVGEAGGVS